ncbi:uncharacterized protein Z518_00535 [Rhinocladiella mackenziei CBS 650.93]|uniref:Rhinocladiella mackenziei CBS 650.93 unplaced genomic scaffold supercont1.1, whole genome shotgun sequence n=1 Tax=Rhinocladiella mackenziei CBS 650.93 TaxID=1442369 RepID=A0A0D2JJ70_9EURO|nr:uncharacterized protein Z518_00535 [Rhinocladiella mackenziei CBS 650.93]KIX09455.1 hypothetical protein Z518_00535 [Rhinocladiella mackenziei CBS 650.93]
MAQNSTAQSATPGRAPRKPYVRLVTDKRREQNRRAQKAYRERLKKKLKVLEEQAVSTSSNLDTPLVSTTDINVEDVPLFRKPSQTTNRLDPRVIDLADAFVAAGDLPFGQGSIPSIRAPVAPPSPTPDLESVEHVHDDYGDMNLGGIWAGPQNSPRQDSVPSASHSKSPVRMTFAPHRIPNRFRFPSPKTVADPYINHMRLVGEDNIEASLAIGLSIGISRSAYLNDHPSNFPSCYVALNNLYPRNSTSSHVEYQFFDTAISITPQLHHHMNSVNSTLRPSPAQLLHPHPSYLDCIIFPHFRDQAVRAAVQGVLDHAELFQDLVHGGLVCWGGTSGLVNRYSRKPSCRKRDMRDSVAWSTRSWEAKRWFLKKWTWLIGTEEDEEARGDVDGIWKSSRWWRSMRGEFDSDEEDEAEDEVQEILDEEQDKKFTDGSGRGHGRSERP